MPDATINQMVEHMTALKMQIENPWIGQWISIQRGDAKWEDFSFEERTCRGWLWPYLLMIDSMPEGSGRWHWWMEAHALGRLPDSPIPKISFLGSPDHGTMRMLEKCLDADWNYRLPDFLDWLLWGFGDGKDRPRVDPKTNEKWYRLFNLGLMIINPCDYWGYLYSETKGRGSWNRSGFYPTPHPICNMMVEMAMSDAKTEGRDPRTMSVNEPCAGTGRMLMEASNYSCNLYGQDIDYVCVAATKINAYLYVPWLVRPAPWINNESATSAPAALNIDGQVEAENICDAVKTEYPVKYLGKTKTGIYRFQIDGGPARNTRFKVEQLAEGEFKEKYDVAFAKGMRKKLKN